MNLRSIDLNLLVVFDALMSTRHVTRAAEKVGLSQPAMSNALRRLRAVFGDELLVRTPGGMQPTPRAMELVEPVRAVLRQIERVLEPDQHFDASTTERTFRLRLSDVLATLVLPSLLRRFDLPGSRISLDVVHLSPERTVDALERDEIDMAVSFGLAHGSTILAEPVMQDRMVCVVRRDHPFAASRPSIEAFLAAKHVRVSMSPTDLRFVDDVLVAGDNKRTVALNLPHWLVVPRILHETDLVAVMPERLFLALADDRLAACELPFASSAFAWSLYWHRRQDRNPAIRWLRDSLRRAVS
ncbi:MAG: LysR family transcriptional regulator [Rhizobiaceae bacterium]|jgi:DNA-binding transcriptional LysR family regulator